MLDLEKAFGFTEHEALHNSVAHKKFMWLYSRSELLENNRGSNSYGDFRFITLRRNDTDFTFYGHGYNDRKEKHIADTWSFHHAQLTSKMRPASKFTKKNLYELLKLEHEEYAALVASDRQSRAGRRYETLARLCDNDEDFAIAEVEDTDESVLDTLSDGNK